METIFAHKFDLCNAVDVAVAKAIHAEHVPYKIIDYKADLTHALIYADGEADAWEVLKEDPSWAVMAALYPDSSPEAVKLKVTGYGMVPSDAAAATVFHAVADVMEDFRQEAEERQRLEDLLKEREEEQRQEGVQRTDEVLDELAEISCSDGEEEEEEAADFWEDSDQEYPDEAEA